MSCAPVEAERLLNTAAWTTDRYSPDPKTTFKDGYPATARFSFNKTFWRELIERYNKGSLSDTTPDSFNGISVDVQRRLNIAWSNVARAVGAWLQGGQDLSGYTSDHFGFFSANTGADVDGNLAFANVHKALGDIINGPIPDGNPPVTGVNLPSSKQTQAAYLVVYLALVVAAAVATNLRGKDNYGNTYAIQTYDVYAAITWVCQSIADDYSADLSTPTHTYDEVVGSLAKKFQSTVPFYKGDEKRHNVFYQLPFMANNSSFGYGQKYIKDKTKAASLAAKSTFDWTTVDEAYIIELLINQAVQISQKDCRFVVFTRYPYLPLGETADTTVAQVIWGPGNLTEFMGRFALDVERMLGKGPPPPGPKTCLPGYYSNPKGDCTAIPTCGPGQVFNPVTEACEGSIFCPSGWYLNPKGVCTLIPTCGPGETFNTVTEACELSPVPSGGGGGGGSGDGGGIALLLLLLLVGLALATR